MNKHEVLRKLRALAEEGTGGEKINAQRKIEELMRKYNITDEELEKEEKAIYKFEFHGVRERDLLSQIMYKVCNNKEEIYFIRSTRSGRMCKTKIACNATCAQKIEIEFLFDFYNRLYKREEEFFFSTFIQKHSLFGELKDGEEAEEQSIEDAMRMGAFMEGMSNETPLIQIPQKCGKE